MTGRTQHSRVGDIPMNIPPKYLENTQRGAADRQRMEATSALKAFDAIYCNFFFFLSQKSHNSGLIESDEMVY